MIHALIQPNTICKIWKLILSEPGALVDAWVINAWTTTSLVILIWANLKDITRGSTRFLDSFRNADFCINTFLAFIDTAVFPTLSLKASVIWNYRGLIYLRPFQQWFLYIDAPRDLEFSYRNFCQHSCLAFRIVVSANFEFIWILLLDLCFYPAFFGLLPK